MKKTDSSPELPKTTKADVAKAANRANVLGQETDHLLDSVKRKNSRAIWWFIFSWSLLFLVAVITLFFVLRGINRQNQLAQQNSDHIDCVIKVLSTPLPAGSAHKYTDYKSRLTADCHIKFTP